MQEWALSQPGRAAGGVLSREDAAALQQRELEGLLEEHAPLVFRVAMGVLRNREEAEDVAQEALLRACRKFHSLREPQRAKGWLVRITFRLALDRVKSRRRSWTRDTEWSRPELRPPAQSAEELAAARQFEERLARALEELPSRLRLVMILSAIDGYTIAEVAGILGVSQGTVKSRMFRARKYLAEKLR